MVVHEGHLIVGPFEVHVFLSHRRVKLGERGVRGEDIANGLVEREVEQGNAALVGELGRILVERVARGALIPLAEEEAVAVGVALVGHGVLPAPRQVLHGVHAEAVHAVLLEQGHGIEQILADGRVFLIEIAQEGQRVVLRFVPVVVV